MRKNASVLPFLALLACAQPAPPPRAMPAAATTAPAAPPAARVGNVSETKFGITVNDPYRWMEGNDNAELTLWLRAQGDYTRNWLARLPGRDALLHRVRELDLGTSTSFGVDLAGGRMFYRHISAGKQLPWLMVRDADGSTRILLDPAAMSKGESHASINACSPSPDGALIACDVALGGGEVSSIHILDAATGKELPDVIDRIWGEFAVSWLPDRSGFFYTQMAAPAKDADPMLNMRVRFHLLGKPAGGDPYIVGGASPEEFPFAEVDREGRWLIVFGGGAHNEVRIDVAPLASVDRSGAMKTQWRKVAEYADGVESAEPHGDRLYMLTFKGASNRKLISVPLAEPDLTQANVEIAEQPDVVIESISAARDALYVKTMVSGRARMLRMPWGSAAVPLPVPYDGWIYEIATDPLRDGTTIYINGWTRPGSLYTFEPAAGTFVSTGIGTTTNADFSGVTAEEVEATSSDGTKVPLSILRRSDLARDGSHPAIVYGYGGYGFSQNPSFVPNRLAWIERGGVYAVCHVRGGGEKGYQWQVNGTHEHKMNGVHDFEACAQYLIDNRYTTAGRVAGVAGSMGGILIGRAITERPDLWSAANVAVGIDNPLRMLAAENGANQKAELGDPDTEAGFKSILEMDPYQHVKPATAYPATIFTVGLNDRRVAPWMTGKMAAAMQAATTSGKPVLIRVEGDAGHGIGSTRDQASTERADVYSFFLAAAGDPQFQRGSSR